MLPKYDPLFVMKYKGYQIFSNQNHLMPSTVKYIAVKGGSEFYASDIHQLKDRIDQWEKSIRVFKEEFVGLA